MKKAITTQVSDERIEATVEVVPGVSIRIRGRAKVGEKDTGVWTISIDDGSVWDGATEWRAEARTKLARLSADTLHTLGQMLCAYHRGDLGDRETAGKLLRDAFLHDADLDLGTTIKGRFFPVNTLRLGSLHAHGVFEPVWQEFDRTFSIGDEVATGSYNLVYTDPIIGITAKTVTTSGGVNGASQRFTLLKFVRANWDLDLVKIRKHNAEEFQCI